jgi:hypothetical protein
MIDGIPQNLGNTLLTAQGVDLAYPNRRSVHKMEPEHTRLVFLGPLAVGANVGQVWQCQGLAGSARAWRRAGNARWRAWVSHIRSARSVRFS